MKLLKGQLDSIDDVIIKELTIHKDDRGYLLELYRQDWLPEDFHPQMAYMSITNPGIARGPHEHMDQTDVFIFLAQSLFIVNLWDRRYNSDTEGNHISLFNDEKNVLVVVPPGVVHGYINTAAHPSMVINCPSRLYKGKYYSEPIDEIRHEADPDSPYKMELFNNW